MEPNDISRTLRFGGNASTEQQTKPGFGSSTRCGGSVPHLRVSGEYSFFSGAILRADAPGW